MGGWRRDRGGEEAQTGGSQGKTMMGRLEGGMKTQVVNQRRGERDNEQEETSRERERVRPGDRQIRTGRQRDTKRSGQSTTESQAGAGTEGQVCRDEAAAALGPAQLRDLARHGVPENWGALLWHVSEPPHPLHTQTCTHAHLPGAFDSLHLLRTLPSRFSPSLAGPGEGGDASCVTSPPPPTSQRGGPQLHQPGSLPPVLGSTLL